MSGNVLTLYFVIGVLVVVALAVYLRHRRYAMYHQERSAALERNVQLPESFFQLPSSPMGSTAYLLRGLIWLSIGIGISLLFLAFAVAKQDREVLAAATLGLIPVGVGIAYLIVHNVEKRREEQGESTARSSFPAP